MLLILSPGSPSPALALALALPSPRPELHHVGAADGVELAAIALAIAVLAVEPCIHGILDSDRVLGLVGLVLRALGRLE
eukprot:SAG22_NODE_2432_length_2578_cov_27.780153_3_plen_79_part_00